MRPQCISLLPLDCLLPLQERAEVEQQHIAAFAAGQADLPPLQGDSRRAGLLCDSQAFLTSTEQARPLFWTCCKPAEVSICFCIP